MLNCGIRNKGDMKKVKILNVEIENISKIELLQRLERGVLITPNIDHLI